MLFAMSFLRHTNACLAFATTESTIRMHPHAVLVALAQCRPELAQFVLVIAA